MQIDRARVEETNGPPAECRSKIMNQMLKGGDPEETFKRATEKAIQNEEVSVLLSKGEIHELQEEFVKG